MFQNDLKKRFERIFGIKKVTFNAANPETPEQDTLFIEIQNVATRLASGKQTARVLGAATVFAQADRLTYGFFAKRIENADHADTKHFFFESEQDIVNSPCRMVNLHERRLGFVFLYDSQYDPDKGELNELTISE